VAIGYIPRFMVHVFGANKLLALGKPFGGIHPIALGEVFYPLMNKVYACSFVMHLLFICHHINLGL